MEIRGTSTFDKCASRSVTDLCCQNPKEDGASCVAIKESAEWHDKKCTHRGDVALCELGVYSISSVGAPKLTVCVVGFSRESSVTNPSACTGQRSVVDNKCCHMLPGKFDWEDAAASCESGEVMGSIHSEEANTVVAAMCGDVAGAKGHCWLGMRDAAGDAVFAWEGNVSCILCNTRCSSLYLSEQMEAPGATLLGEARFVASKRVCGASASC